MAARKRGRVSSAATFIPEGSEIKCVDVDATNVGTYRDPASASNIILLNGIQLGMEFYQRVGSRVEMEHLYFKGVNLPVLTGNDNLVRLLIVYDRQPSGVIPQISEIIQTRSQTGAVTTLTQSSANLDNSDRFYIVRDMQWYAASVGKAVLIGAQGGQCNFGVFGAGTAISMTSSYELDEKVDLDGLRVRFASSSNPVTVADIANGALYACFVSANDAATTPKLEFRLTYKDG